MSEFGIEVLLEDSNGILFLLSIRAEAVITA